MSHSDSTIINNIINGAVRGISLLNTDMSLLDNNTLSNISTDGIKLESSAMNMLSNNSITGPVVRGIYVLFNGGQNTLTGNTISGSTTAINVAGSRHNNINNNTLTDNTTGIALNFGSDITTVDNNTISGATTGIRVNSSNGETITNNTLTGILGNGIEINPSNAYTVGNTILGNNITADAANTTGTGILLADVIGDNIIGDGSAAGRNFINDFATGISISNSKVDINRNVLTDNATGIRLTNNSDDSNIRRNNITGITAKGIYADGSDEIRIANNNISAAPAGALAGIHVDGLTGITRLNNNDVDGFRVGIWNDGTNNSRISGGILSGNTTGAVINPSTNVLIEDVSFTGNDVGLSVTDSTVTLSNNTFDGGRDGLVVSGATSDVIFGVVPNIFQGQTDNFIKLINGGLDNTATYIGDQLFDLVGLPEMAAGLDDVKSFLLEDKLTHASDANGLGLLWWNANNLYASGVIQPSIDAAKLYGFNTVNVNTGVYDENLIIDGFADPFTLTGGNRRVLIQPTRASTEIDLLSYRGFTHGHSGIIHVRGSNDVMIDRINIDGSKVLNGWTDASYAGVVAHDSGVTLDHMGIRNIFGAGKAWLDGAGVSTDSAYGTARNLVITNSTLQNLQNYGVIVAGANQIYNINNSTIDMKPVVGHPSGYWPFGIASIFGAQGRINNNTILNTPKVTTSPYTSSGIFLLQAGNTGISGNTISDGVTGIFDSGSNGILAISGNTITSQNGIFIDSHVGGALTMDGNTITAQVPTTGKGIHLLNTHNAVLSGNNFSNFDIGIHNSGSNNTQILSNTLTDNTVGVRVNPSMGVIVDGNTISGGDTGIEVSMSDGTQILNNIFSNFNIDGVNIEDSEDVQVRDNMFNGDIGRDGIFARNARNILIDGNVFKTSPVVITTPVMSPAVPHPAPIITGSVGVGRDAIHVVNSNRATIHDNTLIADNLGSGVPVTLAGRYGINLRGSRNAEIIDNTFTANSSGLVSVDSAIRANNSRNVLIGGNTMTSSLGSRISSANGIEVTNSEVAVA